LSAGPDSLADGDAESAEAEGSTDGDTLGSATTTGPPVAAE
jgi:hypothetical protein